MYYGNTVLVVDKDPTARYNLKLCLWKLDCAVHETEDEDDAITFIVTENPRAVFISLEFTKINLFYLPQKVRELTDCPLIVYADGFTRSDLMCCIDASVNDVLINPCTQLERLRRIVTITPGDSWADIRAVSSSDRHI